MVIETLDDSLTYLKGTSEGGKQNRIEEKNSSRVEAGCIRGEVVEYTPQNERDKEVTEKGRVRQSHISPKSLESTL
jgi:hypothetical protein